MKITAINYGSSFLFLIIILLMHFNVYNIKLCKWKPFSVSYDTSRKNICKKYINVLNDMKIFYFIGFGSLLGAVRNEGLIKMDKDIDIIVPISNNYNIFQCNRVINITNTEYDSKYVLLTNDSLLCNRNRLYYSKLLLNYTKGKFKKMKIIKTRITEYTVAIWIANNLYIDYYPIIANEWLYRSYNLCRCKFCGLYTYCLSNAYNIVKIIYGEDFITPKRRKSRLDRNIIRYKVEN